MLFLFSSTCFPCVPSHLMDLGCSRYCGLSHSRVVTSLLCESLLSLGEYIVRSHDGIPLSALCMHFMRTTDCCFAPWAAVLCRIFRLSHSPVFFKRTWEIYVTRCFFFLIKNTSTILANSFGFKLFMFRYCFELYKVQEERIKIFERQLESG